MVAYFLLINKLWGLLKTAICHLYHIAAFLPRADHIHSLVRALTLLQTNTLGIFDGEFIGQQLQQVSRASGADSVSVMGSAFDVLTEESHLAVHGGGTGYYFVTSDKSADDNSIWVYDFNQGTFLENSNKSWSFRVLPCLAF